MVALVLRLTVLVLRFDTFVLRLVELADRVVVTLAVRVVAFVLLAPRVAVLGDVLRLTAVFVLPNVRLFASRSLPNERTFPFAALRSMPAVREERTLEVFLISRALVIPLFRRANELSGWTTA